MVSHLLAVQSQDLTNARWAVGQRMRAATDVELERAFDAGEILRTHVMRPTWHFVAPADIRWLLALTAPRVHALGAWYYKKVGLTARKLMANDTAIARALKGTTLTRDELAEQAGLRLAGTPLAYTVMHAELEGVICSGPRKGKQITYALLDERAPPAPARTRDNALAEIARRYVTSHGPATAKDLAWWSGLTHTDAKRAFELASIDATEIDGALYFHVPAKRVAIASSHVRLLPNYDELLIAFADRGAARDPRITTMDSTAFFNHFVVSQGRLIGGYRRLVENKTTVIACTLVVEPTPEERAALASEVERFGTYLGTPMRLDIRLDPKHQARPSMAKKPKARPQASR